MDDRKESIVPVLRKPGTLPAACVTPVKVPAPPRALATNAGMPSPTAPEFLPGFPPLADAGVNSDR